MKSDDDTLPSVSMQATALGQEGVTRADVSVLPPGGVAERNLIAYADHS